MPLLDRRSFLKTSAVMSAALAAHTSPFARILGSNDDVRIGIVGFNGHGNSHISRYLKVPGVRIVALCDPDRDVLAKGRASFEKRNEKVETYTDLRKLLESDGIDAISGATPNHWHCLSAIWACQAGKDACIEKPVSHNIFEGRKAVEAARKYGRMVQGDLDRRVSESRWEAIRYIQSGKLGKMLRAYGFVYKRRTSIGKVEGLQKPPPSVDFDLWCGPAPLELRRKNFHYDWHWQWATGCGETGNNGPHVLDELRWALGQKGLPKRVMSYGGRFGYDDDGNTPNTQVAFLDYDPAPIIFEVRGLPRKSGDPLMDCNQILTATGKVVAVNKESSSPNNASVVVCEHGYYSDGVIYDNDGKTLKTFDAKSKPLGTHFIEAVRSRKISDMRIDIEEGHLSTALCHLSNIAYRAGEGISSGQLREMSQGNKAAEVALEKFRSHLEANGVGIDAEKIQYGPWLEFDSDKERFVGGVNVRKANQLLGRTYRAPFVVPEKV